MFEAKLDPKGLAAAVRECARLTNPDMTDEEFAGHKAGPSDIYRQTERDMTRVFSAYLQGANIPIQQVGKAAALYDHIEDARQAGGNWWANAICRVIENEAKRDELIRQLRDELRNAEAFVRGFEGDPMQEDIDDLLAGMRGAIAQAEAALNG